jgi:hypothetical protein
MQIFVFELKEEKKKIVMSYLMEFVHDKELTFSRHEFGTEVRNEKAFRALFVSVRAGPAVRRKRVGSALFYFRTCELSD